MHRFVAAVGLAAAVLVTGAAPAVAALSAPCKASDLGCQLKAGLEGLSTPGGPTTTTPTTRPPGTSVVAKGPAKSTAAASGSAATPATGVAGSGADASLFGLAVPAVPNGGVLELPPLAPPDFGTPSPVSAAVPGLARPARLLPAPVVTARPAADGGTDAARALGGALAAVTLVALAALGLRRIPAVSPEP